MELLPDNSKHPLCHDPRHDPGIITLLAVIKVRTSINRMCLRIDINQEANLPLYQ